MTACTACGARLPAIVGARFCCWCGVGIDSDARLSAELEQLRAWCKSRRIELHAGELLIEPRLAEYERLDVRTVQNRRYEGRGPRHSGKIGKHWVYALSAIAEFRARQRATDLAA